MMRHAALLMLLLAAGAAAIPASAQQADPGAANHFLEPGDMIRLRIWREPDMSDDFRVDADGIAVLPRLGARQVTGKDPTTLRNELLTEYSRYLRTPAIEVTFLRRILVGGAVQKPDVYYIDPTMTVRDVLAQAGGATPVGHTDRIELVRGGERLAVRLHQDVPIIESPIRSGDQVYVPERSWLSRNTNAAVGIGGALLSFTATMILIATQR
ncbi:MAG: polysaccharide biosynthesis/export family protein [Longimicrobiales bacterium]